jgi:site-specific recombinase XerD
MQTQSVRVQNLPRQMIGVDMNNGTIVRRSGKYGARITFGGRQLWIATFDEQDQAQGAIDRTLRSPYPTVTIDELAERWVTRPDIEPDTNAHNRQMIARFVERYGPRPASSVIRLEAVYWAHEHFSSARYVKALFQYGVKLGICEDNPFMGLSVTKKKKTKTPPTQAQVDKAADAALVVHTGHTALLVNELIQVASQTGLRLHELAGLEPHQLDSAAGSMRIHLIGKHDTYRVVPAPDEIAHILQRRSASRLLFACEGKKLTRQKIHRLMKPVREASGLEDMNWHLLRHHYATTLADRGVLDRDAAVVMFGHTNPRLLHDVYAHPDRAKAVQRVADNLAA